MQALSGDVTALLKAWEEGDRGAFDQLAPIVYGQLRRLASRCMRGEPAGHVLQTTALVNEAVLRLLNGRSVAWHDREHFMAVSARIMRRILVDYARGRASLKRGGTQPRLDTVEPHLDDLPSPAVQRAAALCALDDALAAFARLDPRRAQVAELRSFGGYTVEEIADILNVSPHTVIRDWKVARAWLARELKTRR